MAGLEYDYNLLNGVANQIPVEAINQTLKQMVTDDNRVVLVMLPEKEGVAIPTEAELAQAMQEVNGEEIEAFVDEVKAEPLIPQLPVPGKIVSEEPIEKWGATKLTLSNGAVVIVKTTDFKADEILFDAQALGGTSVLPDSYANSLIFFPVASQMNGLGDYTNKDLQKYLQGKQVMKLAVEGRGSTSVTVDGSTLAAGMYIYALIADGREIDSKRMILTD